MSGHSAALLRVLERSFPGHAFGIEAIRSRDWACATFAAVRHEIAFTIHGDGARLAADAFLDGFEEREFPMPRHCLVEIALVSRTDGPRQVAMTVEALTIEDA